VERYRVRILVNDYERAVDEQLRCVCARYDVRPHVKVGIRDVVPIAGSGLSDADYGYALRAHFDFVVTDAAGHALLAIEFDERHHFFDPQQAARDAQKNRICRHFLLPIIRAGATALRAADHRTLLEWLLEVFLEHRHLGDQQRAAYEDDDAEPAEMDPDDFRYQTAWAVQELGGWAPLDAFANARAEIGRWYIRHTAGRLLSARWEGWHGRDERGRDVGRVALEVDPDRWVTTQAQVDLSGLIASVGGLTGPIVAQDLALLDLARQLEEWDCGSLAAVTTERLEKLTEGMQRKLMTMFRVPTCIERKLLMLEGMRAAGIHVDDTAFLLGMDDDEHDRWP
jgi:hypothetical protein